MTSIIRADKWQNTLGTTYNSVLQVVSTTKTDTFTSASIAQGSAVDVTGLAATITPTSSTSKILVHIVAHGAFQYVSNGYFRLSILCKRNATVIAVGDAAGSRTQVSSNNGMGGYYSGQAINCVMHLDSPATTSALTYQVQVVNATYETASGVAYINRDHYDPNASQAPRSVSSITLMEIAQ